MVSDEGQAKRCSKCGGIKPLAEFYLRKGRPDVRHICKLCWVARSKLPEVRGRRDAAKYHQSPEYKAKQRAGTIPCFTPAVFEKAMKLQAGLCAICAVVLPPPSPGRGGLKTCADHDHATGRARGVLCSACNRGVGNFKDSPENLINAAMYLMNPPLGQA